jgi:excisionase family DNA binding protein
MNTERQEALMRVQEVARELGQSPSTIYRKIEEGVIPAYRLADGPRAALRVPRDELLVWLAGHRKETP